MWRASARSQPGIPATKRTLIVSFERQSHRANEALKHLFGSFGVVIAEHELIDILLDMFLRHGRMSRFDAALQMRPEPLNCVGRIDAALPFVDVVIDAAMFVAEFLQAKIATRAIRRNYL